MRTKFPRKVRRSHYRAHIATVYYISRPPLSQNPPSTFGVATLLQFTSAETTFARQPTILLNENVEL